VLLTAGALLVPVAVIVRFEPPTSWVNSFVLVVRVICEFDVDEAVAFSELRVTVWPPETMIRGPVVVTVLCPSEVTYVYSLPLKSLTRTVVLIVRMPELVNSALSVVPLEDEDLVDEAVDEASVVDPVPVSLCACTPSPARHNIHSGRGNMMAAMFDQVPYKKEIAGSGEQTEPQSRRKVRRTFVKD
jgi:hypothetical protein